MCSSWSLRLDSEGSGSLGLLGALTRTSGRSSNRKKETRYQAEEV